MTIGFVGANVVASGTVTAGAAVDSTSSADLDFTTSYEKGINGKVTNGATGPTVGCTVNVYIGRNSSNYTLFQSIICGTVANQPYPFAFSLPDWVMFASIKFGGNTAQNVTVFADSQAMTGI